MHKRYFALEGRDAVDHATHEAHTASIGGERRSTDDEASRGAYPHPYGGWVVNDQLGIPIDTKTGTPRVYVDERPHPNAVELARVFVMLDKRQLAAREESKRKLKS